MPHTIERAQLCRGQPIQISDVTDHCFFYQLLNQLFAQAFDIHRAPRCKMHNGLDQARPVLIRNAGWQFVGAAVRRAGFQYHSYDLRDDIAGATHHHRISDPHVFTPDFVGVVQGCIGHRNTPNQHRLKSRNRRQCACASYLHVNAKHARGAFVGREFKRHCPARRARHKTQPLLLFQRIDLVHDAINFITKLVASCSQGMVVAQTLIDGIDDAAFGRGAQAKFTQKLKGRKLCRRALKALQLTHAITTHRQRTRRRDGRIKLAQTAGGSIAWVGKYFESRSLLPLVHRSETLLVHINLTTHLDARRCRSQAQGNGANGTHVMGNVFTGRAVTARRGAHQQAMFVDETDSQTVELGLSH